MEQAFCQDFKSGSPKCTIGPAQMNNLKDNMQEIKNFLEQVLVNRTPKHPSG